MIYLLIFASVGLIGLCVWRKRALEAELKLTFQHAFLGKALQALVAFSAVCVFYAVLDLYVASRAEAATLDALYTLQEQFSTWRRDLGRLKPAGWVFFGLLVLLFGFSVWAHGRGATAGRGHRETPRWLTLPAAVVARYSKGMTVALLVLNLLCSFTFLAPPGLGSPLGALSLRIKKVEDQTDKLGLDLRRRFQREARDELLRQVITAAPQPIAAGRSVEADLLQKERELQSRYDDARSRLRIADRPEPAEVSRSATARERALEAVSEVEASTRAKPAVHQPAPLDNYPDEVSGKKLRELERALREPGVTREAAVLPLHDQRELTSQAIEALLKPEHLSLFASLTESFPFAGSILEVCKSAFSDFAARVVERRIIAPYLERLAHRSLQEPEALESVLSEEARRFVDEQGRVEEHWRRAAETLPLEDLARTQTDLARRAQEVADLSRKTEEEIAKRTTELLNRRQAALALLRPRFERIEERFASEKISELDRIVAGLDGVEPKHVGEYLRDVIAASEGGSVSAAKVEELEWLVADLKQETGPVEGLTRIERAVETAGLILPGAALLGGSGSSLQRYVQFKTYGPEGVRPRQPRYDSRPGARPPYQPPRSRPPRPIARR